MDPLRVPQAYGDTPEAAAAELGASNCVRYQSVAAGYFNAHPEPEVLDSLLETLLRRTTACIAAPTTTRYHLIGGIVKLLVQAYNWHQGQSGWIVPLQHFLNLQASAPLMGAAAAAKLSAAGGCAAGADALASFVTCSISVFNMMLLARHQIIAHTARTAPAHLKRFMKLENILTVWDLDRSLARQQMMMVKVLGDSTSRAALCQETPGSLPPAAHQVLTCNRGTATWTQCQLRLRSES